MCLVAIHSMFDVDHHSVHTLYCSFGPVRSHHECAHLMKETLRHRAPAPATRSVQGTANCAASEYTVVLNKWKGGCVPWRPCPVALFWGRQGSGEPRISSEYPE